MQKQKIRLTEEKETLLVPLLSKAVSNRRASPILLDPKAEEILQGIDYDFGALKVPRQTLITVAMRAKKLDSYVQEYLDHSIEPVVLHLGCGLDSRVLRVDAVKGDWYDLDYPEVIELRRNFYTETGHYHMIPSPVMDLVWLDQLKGEGSACIVAEGLLMYLREEEVRELFLRLHERFPGSEICFDAYSWLTAKNVNRHPSMKKTGAQIYWGMDDGSEIEKWHSDFKVLDEWYFSQSEDIASLGLGDRLMFKMVGNIPVAKKAHRILRFRI